MLRAICRVGQAKDLTPTERLALLALCLDGLAPLCPFEAAGPLLEAGGQSV